MESKKVLAVLLSVMLMVSMLSACATNGTVAPTDSQGGSNTGEDNREPGTNG